MSSTTPNLGTGGYFQIQPGDWDNLNRALRYAWDQIDALSGRRGSIPLGRDFDLNGHKAINAADPAAGTDLVTKEYADTTYGAKATHAALSITGSNPLLPNPVIGPGSPVYLEGTHATRPTAAGYGVGSAYFETDRTVTYINVLSSSAIQIWQYQSGAYNAAIGSRPVDLGTIDTGFRFVDTTAINQTEYMWTGTIWVSIGGYLQQISDSATTTITTLLILKHLTSGTAAPGFGAGIVEQLQNAAGALVTAFYETVSLTTATGGSEAADYTLSLIVGGVLKQALKITSAGMFQLRGKFSLYNNAAPTDGQVLIGNTAGGTFDASTLTPGAGISVTNAGGAITVSGSVAPLFDHFADAGNTSTTETDLYSDTIAAGQLGTNGDKLQVEYGGLFVSSATATREVRIYFGGSVIFDSGALTLSLSSAWTIYAMIIRKDAATIRYMISMTTEGAALAAYTASGELGGLTLSGTNILKITGQAGGVGAATNDVVAKLGDVVYVKA